VAAAEFSACGPGQRKISSIKVIIMINQFLWTGRVSGMAETRIPKQIFYGQLSSSDRGDGSQLKRYKDHLKG